MQQVRLAGEQGAIRLALEGRHGDECRMAVTIESWGYRAAGKVWLPLAALAHFAEQLSRCQAALDGEARLASGAGHLELQVTYARRTGEVTLAGLYRETLAEGNELRFRIQTDQTFIAGALPDLAALVAACAAST
jgi:hypothetical protein